MKLVFDDPALAPAGFRYARPGYGAIIAKKTILSDWRHDVR